eukprot:jgi/Mesvir1/13702/Mv02133-RA.1
MATKARTALAAIKDVVLLRLDNKSGASVTAQEFWKASPAVVFLARRPGCALCRATAKELWSYKEKFDSLGVRLVAVVHENIPTEIEAFAPEFWGGELYFDEQKGLFKALGGGQVMRSSIWGLLSPRVWSNGYKSHKEGVKGNLVGDGYTMGGLYVIKAGDGGVQYEFKEKAFGDRAPIPDVIKACEEALGKSSS